MYISNCVVIEMYIRNCVVMEMYIRNCVVMEMYIRNCVVIERYIPNCVVIESEQRSSCKVSILSEGLHQNKTTAYRTSATKTCLYPSQFRWSIDFLTTRIKTFYKKNKRIHVEQ